MVRKAMRAALFIALALPLSAMAVNRPEHTYYPGLAVIKIAPTCRVDIPEEGAYRFGVPELDRALDDIGAVKVEVKFWGCYPPVSGGADLTRYYNIHFPDDVPVEDVCRDLKKLDEIEIAEPWYINYTLLNPNDPLRRNQYGLDLCQANEAFDISTGDPATLVAVVDTGVSLNHTDLRNNIWHNLGEDINGDGVLDNQDVNNRDDDGNGRRDDFFGTDFIDNDGYPDDEDFHGTHCSGIVSGVTNNRTGISSVGFSCGIMGVRCGTGLTIQYGYEGIQYAVRDGAKVISLSWGNYQDAAAAHEVVRYARDHDVLVLCAAGNDNTQQAEYPAYYEEVVAVAATDRNDRRASFSNYGNWIDICAPGVSVLSTYPGNQYAEMDGTSMACPFAASVAILLRAKYPGKNVDEIRGLLLDGADDISNINPAYRNLLGRGRINAYRSLQMGNRAAITIESIQVSADADNSGRLDPGEEGELTIWISNRDDAAAADSVAIILSCSDETVTIENDTISLQGIQPGEAVSNSEEPFRVSARGGIPHTTYLTVTVVSEPGQAEFNKTFEFVIGKPDVLIVDDDDGADTELDYFSEVEAIGRGWEHWDVMTQYSPDAAMLGEYNMVIWNTGISDPPLDDLDRYQLENALSDGANIMLVGRKIGDDQANRSLLRLYFGADHVEDSVRAYTVEGISDVRPYPRDYQLMFGNVEARRSPSTMRPVLGADSLCVYKIGNSVSGLAGVYRDDRAHDSKTVYLGFAFDYASDSRTPRADVLDKLYNWFSGNIAGAPMEGAETPKTFGIAPAYPNPFNGMVRLNISVPNSAPFRLAIYEPSGREAALLAKGENSTGLQTVVWNTNLFAAGVYYAKLSSPGYPPAIQRLVLVK